MSTCAIAPPFVHASVKRRKNFWYSQKDGNWTDPTVWESNAIKRWNYPGHNIPVPVLPQVGDDVYINHTVTVNTAALIVNNVYVSGTLQFDSTARTFTINGDLQATGAVDLSNAAHVLYLNGVNNFVVSFNAGTTSTVIYNRAGDQPVMNQSYRNLIISNIGTKFQTSDLTVAVAFVIQGAFSGQTYAAFESGSYNMTVNGSTTQYGTWSKSGSGSLLFVGLLDIRYILNWSGNPTVETRAGCNYVINLLSITTGTGNWTATTNNQTFTFQNTNQYTFQAALLIDTGITLSFTYVGARYFQTVFLQGVNGISSTSKLLLLANSGMTFTSTAQISATMTTGIFDYTTNSSILGYAIPGGAFVLPYTYYRQLLILLSSVAHALSGNTTISDSVYGDSNSGLAGLIDTGSYTLSAPLVQAIGFKGSGKVTAANLNSISFSGSNDVEVTAGINAFSFGATGSGNWKFSTSNISIIHAGGATLLFNGTVLISGAISLTLNNTPGSYSYTFNSTLNGDNASSNLINPATIHYKASQMPMLTGLLDCSSNTGNTFYYDALGAQDVKGGTYQKLIFGGSGVKTLQGNVVVNTTAGGSWSITGSASINYNGYTITTI